MSYIGSTPTTQSFIEGTDYFNGDGSTTAFTLSRSVVSSNDVMAVVNNVVQQPNTAYTISGTTITFTSAPSAGTSNIYVRYLSTTTQSITPSQNTVSYSTLNSDNQSKLGISFKNRIINGAMTISQRNGTTAVNNDTTGLQYCLDRYVIYGNVANKFTAGQYSNAPAGFVNSLGISSNSAYSVGSGDLFLICQKIEGYNIADLNWGTANAKTVTLSFWAYSSLTGTFSGSLRNGASTFYSYPFTYTISAANTWTQVSITIVGPSVGTWATTTSSGIEVYWSLGAGSASTSTPNSWQAGSYVGANSTVSVVGTSGATLYLTGVQLEVGTQATTFDYRSYGTELALCQRYYNRPFPYQVSMPIGLMNQGAFSVIMTLNPPMRTLPSLDQVAGSLWRFNGYTAGENFANTWTIGSSQSSGQAIYLNASAVPTSGNGYAVTSRPYDTTNYLGFSAEL